MVDEFDELIDLIVHELFQFKSHFACSVKSLLMRCGQSTVSECHDKNKWGNEAVNTQESQDVFWVIKWVKQFKMIV